MRSRSLADAVCFSIHVFFLFSFFSVSYIRHVFHLVNTFTQLGTLHIRATCARTNGEEEEKKYVWAQCSRKWTQTEYCSKFSLCICVFAMWILRVLCPAVCPVYTITSSCMSESVGGRATLLWPINIQDSTIRKKKLKQKVCINTRTTNTNERGHTNVEENLWINTFRKHLAIWSSKLRKLCGVVFYVLQWIL